MSTFSNLNILFLDCPLLRYMLLPICFDLQSFFLLKCLGLELISAQRFRVS
jgi:hypothetical protein